MEKSKKLVLFDIDHTLFNTRLYQDLCYKELCKKLNFPKEDIFLTTCDEVYHAQREQGVFRVDIFIENLLKRLNRSFHRPLLEGVFTQKDIIYKSLYPEVEEEIEKLASIPEVTLGIFSTGVGEIQRAKIHSLIEIFGEDHIYINEFDKVKDIPQTIEKYKDTQVYIVDDLVDVLYNFKILDPLVITILTKREGWVSKANTVAQNFSPDYTILSLEEIKSIIT